MDSEQNVRPSRRTALLSAVAALVFAVVAFGLRARFVQRVGPLEGGGDEWWSVWRAWSVLYEGGKPGNYLHPGLYYDAGALWFAAVHRGVDPLADFVQHQYEYVRQLEYLSAVAGAATVGVLFLLGRALFGVTGGLIAAAMMSVLPLHVLYSQAARVDALFTLCGCLCWWALLRVEHHGRRRDSVLAGVALGLTVSSNYPGALLVIPFLWVHARRKALVGMALGTSTALVTFVGTNPALLTEPRAVWEGFLFQAGMAAHAHPGREGVGPDFYWSVLRDQGVLFVGLGAVAIVWFLLRGPRFPRVVAVTIVLYLAAFAVLRTQFDRYILPPLPWVVLLIGGLLRHFARGLPTRLVALALTAVMMVQSVQSGRLRLRPDFQRTGPLPAEGAQQWLLTHARADDRIWLDADILPLMQAVFADGGGPLHDALQQAFHRAEPQFSATLIKGERVEGSANFKPALITEGRIHLAVACDSAMSQTEGLPPDHRAFYEALAHCPVVFTFDEQCHVRECPTR